MTRQSRGFTLVEILIVVIILGILAAIVIPQFTDASTEAQKSSVSSTLQTIRSQIELFKVQHGDTVPGLTDNTTGATAWEVMLKYSATGVTANGDANLKTAKDTASGAIYGPYMQSPPLNPMNGKNGITVYKTADGLPTKATDCGWVYNTVSGEVYATDKAYVPTTAY